MPPVIIFEGKMHQSAWYDIELPGDWVIGVNILGLIWLNDVFEKHKAHRTKGVYRLLILDGHGSHLTPEFPLISGAPLPILAYMRDRAAPNNFSEITEHHVTGRK
jgi:hypothetical protein